MKKNHQMNVDHRTNHYVDSCDNTEVSWLRYMNCARCDCEQNVVAFQYHGLMYYQTSKDVLLGTEIAVGYRDNKEIKAIWKVWSQASQLQDSLPLNGAHIPSQAGGLLLTSHEDTSEHWKVKHTGQARNGKFTSQTPGEASMLSYKFSGLDPELHQTQAKDLQQQEIQLKLKGRAVDNQLFVATISPARDETASYVAWAHSTLADPWGQVQTKCGIGEEVAYCVIDLEQLQQIRQQIPIRHQRRDDLYDVVQHH